MTLARDDRPRARASGTVDLQPPAAPADLHVTAEGGGSVGLAWNARPGAAGYDVYRSPVTGGGYVKANGAPSGDDVHDTACATRRPYFYVVRALDAAGNESGLQRGLGNAAPRPSDGRTSSGRLR